MDSGKRTPLVPSAILLLFVLLVTTAALPQCDGSGNDVSGPSTTTGVQSSNGGGNGRSCPGFSPPASHTVEQREDGCSALHAPGFENPMDNGCTGCHGANLRGDIAPSCYTCHGREWEWRDDDGGSSCPDFSPPASHTVEQREDGCSALHAPGFENPMDNGCTGCHGANLRGDIAPSCYTCHGREWDSDDHHGGGRDDDDDDDDEHDGGHHGGHDDD